MEEAPRIEGVISSKRISTIDAAKFTKKFLQDFGTYLEEEVDESIEELSTDFALTSSQEEDLGPQRLAHDNLVNFVEYHLGSGVSGAKKKKALANTTNGGGDKPAAADKDGADVSVKPKVDAAANNEGERSLSPKEIRKLEKAKAKELKHKEKERKKEEKKKRKAEKKAAKKEKRRRSKEGAEDDETASKKVKHERYSLRLSLGR